MSLAMLTLAAWTAAANERTRQVDVEVVKLDPAPQIALAYRGSGWILHIPGLSSRLEWDLLRRTRTITRPWRQRRAETVRIRQLYAGGDAGWSFHPYNDSLLTAQAIFGTRKTRTRGFQSGVFLAAGPGLSIANRGVWSLDDGDPRRGSLPTRPSWVSSIGWEFGADLGRRERAPVAWYVRPTLSVWTPWTTPAVPVVHVDVGVRTPASALRGTTR